MTEDREVVDKEIQRSIILPNLRDAMTMHQEEKKSTASPTERFVSDLGLNETAKVPPIRIWLKPPRNFRLAVCSGQNKSLEGGSRL